MNQLMVLNKLILSDMVKGFLYFWLVLSGFLVLGYAIASVATETTVILFVWPIYLVWLCANSFQLTKNNLEYALKLGATRTQFFLSSLIILLAAILIGQCLHRVYLIVLPAIGNVFSSGNVTLVGFQELFPELTLIHGIGYDITFAILLAGLFYLLGTVRFQYGMIPIYVALAFMGVLLLIPVVREVSMNWFTQLYEGVFLESFFLLALIGAVTFSTSHPLLKRMTLR
ncbi:MULTISPECIES: hypothetical protein [Shouchella]|uniref:Uncharacterized protein n=2 Tax=Shouchella TaxID=2893057 RepID=A0ABY7W755_9BACI|nr:MULTISPECIES: hypothetical protein [Shouchella]MED4128614.1 hypothetical protein [Shouchella miscanthi]WDF04772.1 hypothetical protein PQ477_04750 [Shouchella hunanensis]